MRIAVTLVSVSMATSFLLGALGELLQVLPQLVKVVGSELERAAQVSDVGDTTRALAEQVAEEPWAREVEATAA